MSKDTVRPEDKIKKPRNPEAGWPNKKNNGNDSGKGRTNNG